MLPLILPLVPRQVFPALLLVMGVFECPRLQAHACAALVNFVEMCPKDILSKYLDEIVAKLDGIFQVVLKEVRRMSLCKTLFG